MQHNGFLDIMKLEALTKIKCNQRQIVFTHNDNVKKKQCKVGKLLSKIYNHKPYTHKYVGDIFGGFRLKVGRGLYLMVLDFISSGQYQQGQS